MSRFVWAQLGFASVFGLFRVALCQFGLRCVHFGCSSKSGFTSSIMALAVQCGKYAGSRYKAQGKVENVSTGAGIGSLRSGFWSLARSGSGFINLNPLTSC